ncbi:MAG TPA: hypothetical protein VNT79_13895 [Phycisphaerae bacterium]|nr:hypothetical protein [Phycisphaerae bacterium]
MAWLSACKSQQSNSITEPNQTPQFADEPHAAPAAAADVRVLFIGNSHTAWHDLPDLVRRMMEFGRPKHKVRVHYFPVQFLDDLANNPSANDVLNAHSWNFVALQAQKISASGRFTYSRQEGIDFAKQARDRGAQVFLFSEWGRKGVKDESRRTEKIYEEMAAAANAKVAPIGHAWDLALTERPDLPLHAEDGNHQSAIGAFLTASVLYGSITQEHPVALRGFPYAAIDARDRAVLLESAGEACPASRDANR